MVKLAGQQRDDELVAVALNRPWSESSYRSAPANLTITHQAIEKIVRPTGVHVLAIDRPQRLQNRTALTPTWPVEQRRHCTIIVYYNTDNPHLAIVIIIIIFHICIFSHQSINFGVKAQNKSDQYIQKKKKKKQTKTNKAEEPQAKATAAEASKSSKLDNVDQSTSCKLNSTRTALLTWKRFVNFGKRSICPHCSTCTVFPCIDLIGLETPVFICELELCNPCYKQAQEEANGLMPAPEIHACIMLQLHLILTMYSFTDEVCILAIV
ncbi:conserved hypothetical protein [Trichinella spiralis]|uniref:hypothetical protein n=1 Tax=Trichinella spiralis TaxID=6334 RepID=UPI0001EFBACC|nr:conserved hypothetical protein [Trichinella spiralis]